jgi:hypothetical protein
MANITRKQLVNALAAEGIADVIADAMGADVADVTATIAKMIQSANRKRVSKPSAETLRNRQIATELADEINARGAEFTAADIAEFYTDPDGMPLTARKVGALLRQAVGMGFIAVSPEPWSVKHYAPVGFEFAKKPVRVKKAKDENAAE